MNSYIQTDNPLAKVGTETVQVKINVIIPLSANSYQLRWKEAKFTKEGTLAETARMTGVFTLELVTPLTTRNNESLFADNCF
jgi:type IV secretory pathway TrbF-like protein